jgi:hypothetical protein
MAKNNYVDKRKKAATALRTLGTILSRKGICPDTAPISTAAEQCAGEATHGSHSWGYDIANLLFQIPTPKGTLPSKTTDFRVELSISMVGRFDGDIDDQFVKLEVNLEKYAYNETGSDNQ